MIVPISQTKKTIRVKKSADIFHTPPASPTPSMAASEPLGVRMRGQKESGGEQTKSKKKFGRSKKKKTIVQEMNIVSRDEKLRSERKISVEKDSVKQFFETRSENETGSRCVDKPIHCASVATKKEEQVSIIYLFYSGTITK